MVALKFNKYSTCDSNMTDFCICINETQYTSICIVFSPFISCIAFSPVIGLIAILAYIELETH